MNISGVNLNISEDTYKASSINIKNNDSSTESKGVDKVFEDVNISSAEKTSSTKVDSKGLASIMDSTVTDELKNSAETAKASLKALFNKMSGADCVQMEEDGFNLNDMDTEEIVTVVDRIKIMLATYCDDYQVTGDSIDVSQIKDVVGSAGMANQVAAKLKGAGLPDTKDNIEEVNNAAAQAEEIKPLSEGAKNYLVSNKLEPSIENIYKAEHASANTSNQSSGQRNNTIKISDEEWKQLKPQVEALINKAGLITNEQNMNNAKSFIENDIPVTEQNLLYKNELDNLDLTEMNSDSSKQVILDKIISNMKSGSSASSTLVTDEEPIWKMVSKAINTVNSVDVKETVTVTNQGIEFTIANLRAAQEVQSAEGVIQASETNQDVQPSVTNQDAQAITNYRQLEEIRILMTVDAGLSLANQGFNLDTTLIADLVEQLKAMEVQLYGEEASMISEVKNAIYDIKTSPDVMIGAVLAEMSVAESITITDFSQMGSNLKQKFRQAGLTYEAVGTEVRSDLGDSVNKALNSSMESILTELGLEDTKANRDAVRILGYNGMDMTLENINTVKSTYSMLNNVIENMKPETVLSMIRDNLNPMKTDIKDLNEYLIEENEGVDSTEKFSKFLYKLDRTDGITAEEREQFIGIYKMMNLFKKDAGKAVGSLVKESADITMSNLMTAYNSNKAAGIDTTIDETTGMAEIEGTVNYYNNLFSKTAEYITPKSLKTVDDSKAIETRSVENFCETINEVYDSEFERQYYDQYLKDINKITDVENSIIRQLTDNNLQVSINNIMAVQNIMAPDYFKKYVDLNNNEDTDSGESDELLDSFIDKLGNEDEMSEAYQQLADEVHTAAEKSINSTQNQAYSNIEGLRMMGKEIGLIKNLSQKHDYKIPFVIDGEVGTINLQIVEDSEDKGRVAIKLETKELGNISIEGKLSSENLSIFAITDGDEKLLTERINKVTDQIANDLEIEKAGIYVGKSNEVPEVNYNTDESELSMKTLYSFAKALIVGIVKPEK